MPPHKKTSLLSVSLALAALQIYTKQTAKPFERNSGTLAMRLIKARRPRVLCPIAALAIDAYAPQPHGATDYAIKWRAAVSVAHNTGKITETFLQLIKRPKSVNPVSHLFTVPIWLFVRLKGLERRPHLINPQAK
jgi:hypothetical protein